MDETMVGLLVHVWDIDYDLFARSRAGRGNVQDVPGLGQEAFTATRQITTEPTHINTYIMIRSGEYIYRAFLDGQTAFPA
jgi:hypothetical protein